MSRRFGIRRAATPDRVRDRCQAFARDIINDFEDAEASATGKLVMEEIQRPTRIGLRLDKDRRTRAYGSSSRFALRDSKQITRREAPRGGPTQLTTPQHIKGSPVTSTCCSYPPRTDMWRAMPVSLRRVISKEWPFGLWASASRMRLPTACSGSLPRSACLSPIAPSLPMQA